MNIGMLACSLLLAALLTLAQVLFKLFAVTSKTGPLLAMSKLAPLAGALTIYFVVFFLYAYLLRKYELALLYPTYTGLSVLLTFGAGVLLFREQVTLRMLVGCALLVIAVFLIAVPARS